MDRNCLGANADSVTKSLSARRAWIEITSNREKRKYPVVALRKESVDRNYKERPGQTARPKSLSARRAWIEITTLTFPGFGVESRSPQGERG